MSDSQRSNDLHNAGLKATTARLRILHLFEEHSNEHFSAEDVYRRLTETGDDVGLATVYRVLSDFESAGLLIRHNFEEGKSIYERAASGHHDHMVDMETGKIVEFVDEEIEELQHRIAAKHGYEIVSHNLVLFVKAKQ